MKVGMERRNRRSHLREANPPAPNILFHPLLPVGQALDTLMMAFNELETVGNFKGQVQTLKISVYELNIQPLENPDSRESTPHFSSLGCHEYPLPDFLHAPSGERKPSANLQGGTVDDTEGNDGR
ncbi:hypothetical protein PVK06_008333 [Gossypium arboreum]|uniref:Uncharacterized protein n=1 Tax=Gossypium arboreum TaxID=29729 RepID=A0ABR0QJP0_GOSAR|nr:hypothetical protein PVK06_008333 [Gossypium arboreum]